MSPGAPSRSYVLVNGERHIRREIAEAHGITSGQPVDGEKLATAVRESIELDGRYVRGER